MNTQGESLLTLFHRPLPEYLAEIKKEAADKCMAAPLIKACSDGDLAAIRALIIHYWPFVDTFPKIINDGVAAVIQKEVQRIREIIGVMREALQGVERDETNHRGLWLTTAGELYLTDADLFYTSPKILPEVQEIIQLTRKTDPFALFLRFVAVEIVAEAISIALLRSEEFRQIVGGSGLQWFNVHVDHHDGMSHEEVTYRLAFAFRPDATREEVNAIIQQLVDLFISAGDEALALSHA